MSTILKRVSRVTAAVVIVMFSFNSVLAPVSYAQLAFLPQAGTMVPMTSKFDPMVVKGIKFYPDNPFKFDFIVDTGDMPLSPDEIRAQGQKLADYFLASLTTPEKEMWVNLSPYEKNRIIPADFGDTQMGAELLSEDYMLKQIMATALYPERQLGQEFWAKVYAQAQREFGTTNVPVSTFNKVWIVPNKAVVYQNAQTNSVFVVESSLKVMLEKDYLAANKHKAIEQYGMSEDSLQKSIATDALSTMSSNIIKQIVIPALEKEVNEGKNFASLRQVYQSLILAAWYKKNLRDTILGKGYVDRGKTLGVDTEDKQINEKIYRQYLKAYRKGAYNYIKEDIDPATNTVIPRKYFSGGVAATNMDAALTAATVDQARLFDAAMGVRARISTVVAIGIGLTIAASAGAQAATYMPDLGKGHHLIVTKKGVSTEITTRNQYENASRYLSPGTTITYDQQSYNAHGDEYNLPWLLSNRMHVTVTQTILPAPPAALNVSITPQVPVNFHAVERQAEIATEAVVRAAANTNVVVPRDIVDQIPAANAGAERFERWVQGNQGRDFKNVDFTDLKGSLTQTKVTLEKYQGSPAVQPLYNRVINDLNTTESISHGGQPVVAGSSGAGAGNGAGNPPPPKFGKGTLAAFTVPAGLGRPAVTYVGYQTTVNAFLAAQSPTYLATLTQIRPSISNTDGIGTSSDPVVAVTSHNADDIRMAIRSPIDPRILQSSSGSQITLAFDTQSSSNEEVTDKNFLQRVWGFITGSAATVGEALAGPFSGPATGETTEEFRTHVYFGRVPLLSGKSIDEWESYLRAHNVNGNIGFVQTHFNRNPIPVAPHQAAYNVSLTLDGQAAYDINQGLNTGDGFDELRAAATHADVFADYYAKHPVTITKPTPIFNSSDAYLNELVTWWIAKGAIEVRDAPGSLVKTPADLNAYFQGLGIRVRFMHTGDEYQSTAYIGGSSLNGLTVLVDSQGVQKLYQLAQQDPHQLDPLRSVVDYLSLKGQKFTPMAIGPLSPPPTIEQLRAIEKRNMEMSAGAAGNSAMIAPPIKAIMPEMSNSVDPFGGIDLEKVAVESRGDKGMKSAFNDPHILQMVLDAGGLAPLVKSVEFVTVPMVNMLLGFNDATPDNNGVPTRQADNKTGYLKTAFIDIRKKMSYASNT